MISPDEAYKLTKALWTQEDFDQMGWHDVLIHAITFVPENYEFVLDVDYLFAWVQPSPPSIYYSFWIAPATLVFRNVVDFKCQFSDPLGLQIMDLKRENSRPPKNAAFVDLKTEWTWTMDLLQGEISFSSIGFRQYVRSNPIHTSSAQYLTVQERGGISFDRKTCEVPN
jgi:hypothetical protein